MRTAALLILLIVPVRAQAGAPSAQREVARAVAAVTTTSAALAKACLGARTAACLADGQKQLAAGDAGAAARSLLGACYGGDAQVCYGLVVTVMSDEPVAAVARSVADRGCSLGEPNSCAALAHLLARGQGGVQDTARAIPLWQRSCEQKIARSCHDLGVSYAQGNGVPADDAEAARLYIRACELDPTECTDAGVRLIRGWGVPADAPRGFAMLERGCAVPRSDACSQLAEQLIKRAKGDDLKRAPPLLAKSCEMDAPHACVDLGVAYAGGTLGLAADETKAMAAFRRAADLFGRECSGGIGRSCAFLAGLYRRGLGVAEDAARAESLEKKACEYDPRHCPGRGKRPQR